MRVLLSGLAVLAAIVLMTVSAILNYAFMASFARSDQEALMLGAAAVAGDLIKACLPFFIVLAWRGRRIVFTAIGSVVFGFLTLVSLVAALGYAADVRGGTAQARQALSAELQQAEHELARVTASRAAAAPTRAAAVVTEEISKVRQDRLWASSNECTDATVAASRTYCAGYFALRSELAAAVEANQLEARERDLVAKAERLRASGAGQEAEPQVAILANLTGNGATAVRTALILAAGIFIEVGSGLGLYLALHHSGPQPMARGGTPESRLTMATLDATAAIAITGPASAKNRCAADAIDQIERYGVARLQSAQNGRVSISQIYADYQQWCAVHGAMTMPQTVFDKIFNDLVRDIGIVQSCGGYDGIVLGGTSQFAPITERHAPMIALAPGKS